MNLKQKFISTLPGAYEAITSITGVTPKNRAQGVDVSHWQGYFRPETAKHPIHFAIQKITEGTSFVDPKIDGIWSGIKQVEMRGAYHYQRSGVSWLRQADFFLNIASKYDYQMIMLDVEKINNTLDATFAADSFRIINHWRIQAPSKKILLYSNKDVFGTFIYPMIKLLYGSAGLSWLEDLEVWYSQYWNLPSVDKDPSLLTWMKTWRLWQIADKYFHGPDWGVQSLGIDINVHNGTPDEMRAWLGLTSQPPVEPDPPPIVVEPPARPDVTPETRLWSAEVLPLRRMIIRSYPIVADDTVIRDASGVSVKVYGGELFKGVLWSGNNYVWMRIDQYPSRPSLVGKWVAVRTTDGTEKFITLRSVTTPSVPTVTGTLFRVRKWGDPVLVREGGLSVSIVGTSNFQAVGLYNKLTGWGGVSNHLTIPRSDITKLMALQVEDEYIDKKPDMWREQKMNWLCKPRGTIYFTKDGPSWPTADEILWGTIALGGNLVQVEEFEYMTISTPNDGTRRLRKMARLSGFRKTDWVRPLIELVSRGLVHRCYCAYSGDDFGDSPKGIIYSPFWSPLDWDFAGNAQPQAFYLPEDWLEAV